MSQIDCKQCGETIGFFPDVLAADLQVRKVMEETVCVKCEEDAEDELSEDDENEAVFTDRKDDDE